MSIEIKEKTIEIIDDCRHLSRAEMLGIISFDVYNGDQIPEWFFENLIRGKWTITCDPDDNTIKYCSNIHDFDYSVIFIPMQEKGIKIQYFTNDNTKSYYMNNYTHWSLEDLINFVGI